MVLSIKEPRANICGWSIAYGSRAVLGPSKRPTQSAADKINTRDCSFTSTVLPSAPANSVRGAGGLPLTSLLNLTPPLRRRCDIGVDNGERGCLTAGPCDENFLIWKSLSNLIWNDCVGAVCCQGGIFLGTGCGGGRIMIGGCQWITRY